MTPKVPSVFQENVNVQMDYHRFGFWMDFSGLPPIYLGFPFENDFMNIVENTRTFALKRQISLEIQEILKGCKVLAGSLKRP